MADILGIDGLRKQVAALTGALSVSLGGYTLLSNPEGYVRMVLLTTVVNAVYGAFDWLGKELLSLNRTLQDAVFGSLVAAGEPFRIAGGLVLDLLVSINGVFVGLAGMAGPLAFVIPPLMWFVLFSMLAYLLGFILQVIKWVT